MQSALQVDSEIRVASKPALRLPSLPPGASDDSDLVDAIMARPPAPGRRDLAAGSERQPGGSAVLYSEIQNLLFSNACTKIFTVYVQNFSPFWGLSFSPFFYPPVEVESVSERANYTLLFKTLVRIHFLPPFFIPFLPPFFIPFLPLFFIPILPGPTPVFHTNPTSVFHTIPTPIFHTIPTFVFSSPAQIPPAMCKRRQALAQV